MSVLYKIYDPTAESFDFAALALQRDSAGTEKISNGDAQQVLLNINTGRGLYLLHISNGRINTTEKIIVQ